MLLDRQGIVGAALDRSVVRHDHALLPVDAANPGNDAGGRSLSLVHAKSGQGAELEKGASRVQQTFNPIPNKQFTPRAMPGDGGGAAAEFDGSDAFTHLVDQSLEVFGVGQECRIVGLYLRLENGQEGFLLKKNSY